MTGLTGKQSAFVDAYLGEAHYNAAEAARIAGYSGGKNGKSIGGQASGVMHNPKVIAAISARKALKSNQNPLTTNKVLADLDWAIEQAKTKNDLVSFLRGVELQGKYLAMWTDKSQIEDLNETKRMEERREEEARQIAQTRLRLAG